MATPARLELAIPDRQSSVIPIHHGAINNNMRTSLIVFLIISFLLNIAFVVAIYDIDNKSKTWKTKYFTAEKIANDQQGQAAQLALDKFHLQEQLKEIETRTANTNKMLEDTQKELDVMSKKFNDKTKELEISKQISSLPFSCPSPLTIKPKVKHKKKIPYDISPSQQ